MNNTATYNTNENVSLVINARIDSREMMNMVSSAADTAVKGNGQLPEEIADLFNLEIVTRPSGSKYGVLTFA